MDGNQKPFMWLGKKILPYKKDFGGDIDAEWQYPVLESWLTEESKSKYYEETYGYRVDDE